MARKAMVLAVIVGFWMLSVGHELGAEPKKVRTDLTGSYRNFHFPAS